jgi:holo-[acyl-carrier protein] synthase
MRIIGIGTDVVPVDRIARIAERDKAIFLSRVLGDQERAELQARARGRNQWDAYAQHFAAKESLFKALGTGLVEGMSWRDVQVVVTDRGHDLRISGETGRRLAAAGMTEHWLSLGCAGGLAVAVVVLGGQDDPSREENSPCWEERSDEDEWRP